MVCKEDVVTWFKESHSYKRIDLMCSLLNMCLPFELRFLGTCVEVLGKRDFHDLRDAENRANNLSVLSELQSVSEKRTRRSVAIYLSLLHSSNHSCSNALYRILANFDYGEINTVNGSVSESDLDVRPLEELLLLYTMALNHPAFTYEQKSVFGSILLKLQEEENKLCLSKNVLMFMNPQLQVGEIDPSLLTCGANQYSYVQQPVTAITAIPVSCAPERKVCSQTNVTHEMANGSQGSISRNGPSAPQPLFFTVVQPGRYPLQHARQQHHPDDSPLQVATNCRSVPSPTHSPTHSSNPSEDSSVPVVNPPSSPPLTSSPTMTVVSARVNRRRQQSASPGVGESVEGGEGPPRVSRGHRGGSNVQRRPSPKRHQARARGVEQVQRDAVAKELARYGSQMRDAEEGSEEAGNADPDVPEIQPVADPLDAQRIGTCLTHTISSPLNESVKGNDAVHLGSSSPPITAPHIDDTSLVKNRLCILEEGDGNNLLDGRTMVPPHALTLDGGRVDSTPEEDSAVQSMQWVRAAVPSATAAPMAPRQPCPPHTRPSIQRVFTNCSSGRGSGGEQGSSGAAPVPSSPSSAFSSSSSLSSSSSSSSSGVSPQPPPPPQVPPPPTSSVPYSPTPPQVPPPFLSPHPHLLPHPHHHPIRFPATTFAPGFLSASGGAGAASGAGGGATQPVGSGSYLTPGSGGPPVRHSFPFAPNGLAPGEIMYAAVTAPPPPPPPYHTHSGHHPRVGGAPAVLDHSASLGYPPYIPVLLASRGKGSTCYNCGGHTHHGKDCRELTMEEITRPGSYRLDYSRQKSALVGSMGGGGPGGTSSGGGETAGVVDE